MYIVLIFTKDGTPQVLDGQIVWWSFVQIGDTLLSESVVFKLWNRVLFTNISESQIET